METIDHENKKGVIMGDFNIDLLKCGSHSKTNTFIDTVFGNGFLPVITKPTRLTHISATLIDHSYINSDISHSLSGIIITDIADHYGVFHIIESKHDKHKIQHKINKRQINERNTNTFLRKLSDTDFAPVFHLYNANEAYNIFIDVVLAHFKSSFPLKLVSLNKSRSYAQPWITKGLRISSKTKNKLYHKQHTHRTETCIERYKTFNRIYNKLKRKAKNIYFQHQLPRTCSQSAAAWTVPWCWKKKSLISG